MVVETSSALKSLKVRVFRGTLIYIKSLQIQLKYTDWFVHTGAMKNHPYGIDKNEHMESTYGINSFQH